MLDSDLERAPDAGGALAGRKVVEMTDKTPLGEVSRDVDYM